MTPAHPAPTSAGGAEVVKLRPAAPPAKPRGVPASAEVVELYRLLYVAERPLDFDEIADALPGEYRSHAYREYRANLTEQGVPVKEDKWNEREKGTAWRWWVGELVETSARARHVTVKSRDGSGARKKPRDQLVYSADRAKPPSVIQQVTEDRLVQWTPTIGDTGKRHAAGMAFLQQIRTVLETPKLDPARARELLELAEKAIRS